jgi:hypothetical protein
MLSKYLREALNEEIQRLLAARHHPGRRARPRGY